MPLTLGIDSTELHLLIVLCGGWLAIVAGEKLAEPTNRIAWRNGSSVLIHLGIYTLIFFVLVGVTHRAYLSALFAITGILAVIIVNNAKYKALREPFIFTDFSLFSQALQHPRLYLPFLNPIAAVVGPIVTIALVFLGFALDPPLTARIPFHTLLVFVTIGCAIGAACVLIGTRYSNPPTFDIRADIERYGLVPSLWLHRVAETQPTTVYRNPQIPLVQAIRKHVVDSKSLHHLIVVQSESFFDARRLLPTIKRDVLQNYDRIVIDAKYAGRLHVPAWGANTMRTEFAVLTGINRDRLGVHWFNPYRKIARQPLRSLASSLRSAGFDTVGIHPHPESFFGRDKVFPALGFERFLDIDAFRNAKKFGPYTCDASVTEKIFEVLQEAVRPTFVFAITMENHGPLHLEQVPEHELSDIYAEPPPAEYRDLSVYLRHLKHADQMIGSLTELIRHEYPASTLVFYGDHVPSMPAVYKALDFDDGRSDYFIWTSRLGNHFSLDYELNAEDLASHGLLAAGLIEPETVMEFTSGNTSTPSI